MRAFIIILFFSLAFPSQLLAAFSSVKDGRSEEAAWNPNPLPDDIELPMPCGLYMILRPVDISTPSLIMDRHFPMGIVENSDPDRTLYEDKFTGYISSPFTLETLPPSWRKKIAHNKNDNLTWYFIGKYEVSQLQWDAVMQALNPDGVEDPSQCPNKADKKANLPVSSITWFDAQAFLNRYNSWLIKNHYKDMPGFADTKNISFLRLPTEEEWEYAARGGGRVPPDWWQSDNFFPMEKDKRLEDFGIFNSGTSREGPAPIGSRNPNPLGIYDTAGNVEEMVDGLFRMSVADKRNGQQERRLHGASGGLLTKGGNFRSDPSKVLPGNREEHALYSVNGPVKARDIGFRLALGGLNMDGSTRKDELRKEASNPAYLAETQNPSVNIDEQVTSLGAVEALAANAEGDLKRNLLKLRSRLQEEHEAQSLQDSRNLEKSYRSLLYQAETLRALAFRYSYLVEKDNKLKELMKENLNLEQKERANKILAQYKNLMTGIQRSLIMGANYYKSSLEGLMEASPKELARLGEMTKGEYEHLDDIFNKHMLENIESLKKFIAQMQGKKPGKVTSTSIIQTILPKEHYELLPIAKKKG